jgi:hypothetical protein
MLRIFLLLVTVIGLNVKTLAQGDLLVTPRRVVFEGKHQKEELNLVNIGKDTVTYTITFQQFNMKEDGAFELIENSKSDPNSAEPYLRIFPRKVTLAPKEPQVIMMQYKRKADMADGEYRSHLYFRADIDNSALGQKKVNKDSTMLGFKLIPVYGLSIPVIIRTGNLNVKAELSELKLESQAKGKDNLKFALNRKGNKSLYGDIRIEFKPDNGKAIEITRLKGVGVYTNIEKRYISVKIDDEKKKLFTKGRLKVYYESNSVGKPEIYAESEIKI